MKTIETEILEVIEELTEIEGHIKHLEFRMGRLRLVIESIMNIKKEVLDEEGDEHGTSNT